MGRYILGKKLSAFPSGLTDVLDAGTMRARRSGPVVHPGRVVALGAWIGANGTAVSKVKLGAHLLDPVFLDPTFYMAETDVFPLQNLWIADGAGGTNVEEGVIRFLTMGMYQPWMLYKADALELADGVKVDTWIDASGNSRHASNSIPTDQPAFYLNRRNGLPVVEFNGTSDDLSSIGLNLPKPCSIYFALRTPAIQGSEGRVYHGSGNTVMGRFNTVPGNAVMHAGVNYTYATGLPASTWQIHSHIYNGPDSIGAVNGEASSPGDTGANGDTPIFTIGSAGSTLFIDMELGELVAFAGAHNEATRNVIEGILSSRWDIDLVAGHPYEIDPPTSYPPIMLAGYELAIDVVANGSLRLPSRFFLEGKKWEQEVTALELPMTMIPTVETVDNREVSAYAVIEENRPPIITEMHPAGGEIVTDTTPDFSLIVTDPDRSEGLGDYPTSVIVRIWEKVKGSLRAAGARFFPVDPQPQLLTPVNIDSLTWSMFDPKFDLGTRMSTRLAAWETNLSDLDEISTLLDDSGNGNNATQSTPSLRPTFRTNQINTYPAVHIDTTRLDIPISASSLDEAIFAVVRLASFATAPTILGTSGGGGRWLGFDTTGHLSYQKQGSTTISSMAAAAADSVWVIVRAIVTPHTLRLGINDTVENFFHNLSLTASLTTILGMAHPSGAQPLDGDVADLIVMKSSDLLPGDEERIVGSLAHFYDITSVLSSAMPYKTLEPGLRTTLSAPVTATTNLLRDMPELDPNDAFFSWTDVGTPAQHAIQPTPANHPLYREDRLNGYGSIEFDGVDDYMFFAASASSLDEAIFAVIRPDSVIGNIPILGPTVAGGRLLRINGGFLDLRGTSSLGTSSPLGIAPNTWSVIGVVLTPTGLRYCINGEWTNPRIGVLPLSVGATTLIGANDALTIWFDGQIATLVRIPSSSLDVDGADRWIGKLAWDYGLEEKLPEDHPFRFVKPGDPVEHHWTAEVWDQIGDVSGTGYGARTSANELPDGSTAFNISLSAKATPLTPATKTTSQTPLSFSVTYDHALGKLGVGKRIRLLKMNSSGEYIVDQTSPVNIISAAPASTVVFSWLDAGFAPLSIGADYAVEWQFTDSEFNVSPWIGRSEFHVNYPPSHGNVTSPTSPAAVTAPPLILFSVDDPDDSGVAYFGELPALIHELNIGGVFGSGDGEFGASSINQIAIAPDGHLWITDYASDRVQNMNSSTGAYIRKITLSSTQITGVTTSASGDVYIAYKDISGDYTIDLRTPAGVLIDTATLPYATRYLFASPVIFSAFKVSGFGVLNSFLFFYTTFPGEGLVDAWGIVSDSPVGQDVWVVDSARARVVRLNTFDNTSDEWGSYGWGPGQLHRPVDIALHPQTGNFWVTDIHRHKVIEFTREGEFLREFGGYGGANGQFKWPTSVAISPDGTHIFVADMGNFRVQKFRFSTDADLASWGVEGEVAIKGPIEILNQDFDLDLSNWVYSESGSFTESLAVHGDSPISGPGFARISLAAGPTVVGVNSSVTYLSPILANSFPVVEGEVYTVSAYFRRSNQDFYGQVGIMWFDVFGTDYTDYSKYLLQSISYGTIVRSAIGTWQKAVVSDIAPENAIFAYPYLLAGVDVAGAAYPVDIDWDHVEIGPAVRYVRGATFLIDDAYDYQLVSNDMPTKGTYTVMARGKDGTSAGPWSDPVVIDYIDGPTATILSPIPGQVFNTATPTFLWQLTGGEQWAYKVEVLDIFGVLKYDSGWIQGSAIRSHLVPQGFLDNGGSYVGRLWIDDGTVQVLV